MSVKLWKTCGRTVHNLWSSRGWKEISSAFPRDRLVQRLWTLVSCGASLDRV
jgi:hypothetical protein